MTHTNIRLSLPAHGVIEFLAGLAMMVAPAVFGFGSGALVISVALGAILTGMALDLSTSSQGQTFAWHGHFDSIFMVTTALFALALANAGQAPAAIVLATVVGVQASLSLCTRYVVRP